MPKMSQMFPSKWLAAADLNEQDITLTIQDVQSEIVGQGDEAESKWVVYFREVSKGLVLNKTNAGSISGALGDDTDDWIGRQIVLYPTEVAFGGKMVEAIRVKEKATRQLAQQAIKRAAGGGGKPAPAKAAATATEQKADDDDVPF